jgi:hypothetical protein
MDDRDIPFVRLFPYVVGVAGMHFTPVAPVIFGKCGVVEATSFSRYRDKSSEQVVAAGRWLV